MYKNLEALDPALHKTLVFDPKAGFSFARDLTVCLLAPFEAPEAAKEYPVVFTQQGPSLPQAVLYAGHGRHPFISNAGQWLGRHVPVILRAYPFILGALEEAEGFTLMADMDAPHFHTGQGESLFDDDNAPGELLNRKIALLRKFFKSLQQVNALLSPLRQGGFFSDDPVLVQDRHERGLELKGFSTVRPQTLSGLDPKILSAMAKNGLLDLFYAHQHSLTNFAPILRASGGLVSVRPAPGQDLFAQQS